MYIPINLIFITKTFDQFQKIINLVLYLIKLNPNNIFYLINKNSKLVSIKIETKFLKENKGVISLGILVNRFRLQY